MGQRCMQHSKPKILLSVPLQNKQTNKSVWAPVAEDWDYHFLFNTTFHFQVHQASILLSIDFMQNNTLNAIQGKIQEIIFCSLLSRNLQTAGRLEEYESKTNLIIENVRPLGKDLREQPTYSANPRQQGHKVMRSLQNTPRTLNDEELSKMSSQDNTLQYLISHCYFPLHK